jgi:CheY-like chemotaxis protein
VLVNLAGNAVKFTERGSVDVEVEAIPLEGKRWQLVFRVLDTGIGMSREQLGRLFLKFTQADSSAARKYGGTGLGLAISKHLAALMDGVITAQSELGSGSVFEFRLPLETAPGPLRAGTFGPPVFSDLQPCRILLAEDNLVNVKVAVGMLSRLGCSVTVAGHGAEALEALSREVFDIVLMDCQMPEMDGFEATRIIRRQCGHDAPVIIAMTANAMEGDRERCLLAGMDDYLAKPIMLDDLASCLKRWSKRASTVEPQPVL